jgi:hypothetical protein
VVMRKPQLLRVLILVLCQVLAWRAVASSAGPYRDAHEPPPAGWLGSVFKLRQDYPTTPPPPETMPWQSIDFRTNPEQYIKAVLDYCEEGMIASDWRPEENTTRAWYHAPWLDYGVKGREFIRGLTNERSSRPGELSPNQKDTRQSWAVGFYNAPGGYVLGQVWADPDAPDPTKALFPEGTVSCKLLFTTATEQDAPYLSNALEWDANIYKSTNDTTRSVQKVRLLQIDVAVREARADGTTGWIFATFVYDGNLPGATPWDRLVPVGLMWGNDPKVTSANATPGALKETWINPSVGPPQHLGRAGRLNGPVDNKVSSCLSCHSTAQMPQVSNMTPPANATNKEAMKWFGNLPAGGKFDPSATALDYSLQLAAGLQNFSNARPAHPVPAPKMMAAHKHVYPVHR